jgi:hypothetical protein
VGAHDAPGSAMTTAWPNTMHEPFAERLAQSLRFFERRHSFREVAAEAPRMRQRVLRMTSVNRETPP